MIGELVADADATPAGRAIRLSVLAATVTLGHGLT